MTITANVDPEKKLSIHIKKNSSNKTAQETDISSFQLGIQTYGGKLNSTILKLFAMVASILVPQLKYLELEAGGETRSYLVSTTDLEAYIKAFKKGHFNMANVNYNPNCLIGRKITVEQ